MIPSSRSLLLPLWLFTFVFLSSTPGDDLDLEEIRKTLGKLAQEEMDKGVASVSIALVKDGKIVLKEAWGYSNVWGKTKARPGTIYCTGSTFKAVTATGLLQLVEQGKLSLDDPANKYLGEHKFTADKENKVTVRQLLNHTSGLSVGAAIKSIWSRELPIKLEEIPGKMKVVAKPGEKWAYNNFAYAVAGLILEKVSGQEYEEYVVEKILRPLGVKTRGPIRPKPEMMERMALPYMPSPQKKPTPLSFVHYDVYPAGDVYLTAEDMARFLGMHLNGGQFNGAKILSSESIKQAHKPGLNNYALGWGTRKAGGMDIISHGGGVPGFQTFMIGDKKSKTGAYVMSNSGNMSKIGNVAVLLLNGVKYTSPKERKVVDLPKETLEEYVGEYQLGAAKITIRLKEKQLSAKLTGQGYNPIYPEAKDKLFYKVVDAQYTVKRDKKGKVSAIVLHQNGIDQEAKKIK